MLEIELKFPVADFAAIERRLRQWGAEVEDAVEEADHYFNAPDRDFGQTGEAFRLRRVGDRSRLTYKGPKLAGPTKTRTEIEVPLAEGLAPAEALLTLVRSLGYRPVAVVRKRRVVHRLRRDGFDLNVCLDAVDRLGTFVEVEIVAAEADRDEAQRVLLRAAGDLGLTEPEPRSYLRMVLALGSE